MKRTAPAANSVKPGGRTDAPVRASAPVVPPVEAAKPARKRVFPLPGMPVVEIVDMRAVLK